jgi:hypothetical protein
LIYPWIYADVRGSKQSSLIDDARAKAPNF